MTEQQHPITPPPELVEDWIELAKPLPQRPPNPNELATLAARWGADQELEACFAWLQEREYYTPFNQLRTARRPKLPSLKEKVSKALSRVPGPGADSAYLHQWLKTESASLINDVRQVLEKFHEV